MTHLRPKALPAFVAGMGLTSDDVAALGPALDADAHALHAVLRGRHGQAAGVERITGAEERVILGVHGLFAAGTWAEQRSRVFLESGTVEALCAAACERHRPHTVYAAIPGQLTVPAGAALLALIQKARISRVTLGFSPDPRGHALARGAWSWLLAHAGDDLEIDEASPQDTRAETLRARRARRAGRGAA